VPENTSFWLVICAKDGGGIQLVPEIAAGARDGGPSPRWSGQRETRSEGETGVTGVLAAARYSVQSWERSALIGRFLGESTESVPSGAVGGS
jgi:hypothetical protein